MSRCPVLERFQRISVNLGMVGIRKQVRRSRFHRGGLRSSRRERI